MSSAASAKNIVTLADLLPAHLRNPRVGIVCGSGLGTLAKSITERVIVPYSTLEGFGESTGESHWPAFLGYSRWFNSSLMCSPGTS
jgi:purine nucleoside phosphorylase